MIPVGGTFTPHCARVNPAALARGLADAAERRGVTILEQTPVADIARGVVTNAFGSVNKPMVTTRPALHRPGGATGRPQGNRVRSRTARR